MLLPRLRGGNERRQGQTPPGAIRQLEFVVAPDPGLDQPPALSPVDGPWKLWHP